MSYQTGNVARRYPMDRVGWNDLVIMLSEGEADMLTSMNYVVWVSPKVYTPSDRIVDAAANKDCTPLDLIDHVLSAIRYVASGNTVKSYD